VWVTTADPALPVKPDRNARRWSEVATYSDCGRSKQIYSQTLAKKPLEAMHARNTSKRASGLPAKLPTTHQVGIIRGAHESGKLFGL
jgi:hypothetical protein